MAWECLPGDVLRHRGTCVGRLLDLQGISFGEKVTNRYFLGEVRRLRPSTHLETPYPGGGTVLDAYCNTLVSGEFAESLVPPVRSLSCESSKELLQTIWATEADWDKLTARHHAARGFPQAVATYGKNRSIYTTERGLIALAPKAARPGDQVCILLRCNSCILLRLASNTRWQVVGECHVPGLITREALVGPLPESFRSMAYLEKSTGLWLWSFQNIAIDEIQCEDPHFDISKCPRVGSGVEGVYRNMLTDQLESRMWSIDDEWRRLEYPWREENILKRGVQLEDFDLI